MLVHAVAPLIDGKRTKAARTPVPFGAMHEMSTHNSCKDRFTQILHGMALALHGAHPPTATPTS
jgi:hypothetical protein